MRVKKKAEILESTCAEHRKKIDELKTQTSELELRASAAENVQKELHTKLQEQTKAVELELSKHEDVLEEQMSNIRNQKETIDKLRGLCSRQDIVVDIIIVLSAIWFSSITLFKLPFIMISNFVSKNNKKRRWIVQALRSVFVFIFVKYFRNNAINIGMHSSMTTWADYLSYVKLAIQHKLLY